MANQTDTTEVTLTEHLPARDNTDDSINGHAKITYFQTARGTWEVDSGEELQEEPEYRVEASTGETFASWQEATNSING